MSTQPVARFRGYMVEVTQEDGSHVYFGRHEPAGYDWRWNKTHNERSRTKACIVAGWGSAGLFHSRETAKKAICASLTNDAKADKFWRRTFRIIPVVVEAKLRLRPMVGMIAEPTLVKYFGQLKGRTKTKRRKAWRKKDLL